jgi:hypothetical protein
MIIIIFVIFIILVLIIYNFYYYNELYIKYKQLYKNLKYKSRIIISLTTSPSRLSYCLNNLMNMINNNVIPINSEIHLNLPKVFKRTGETYPYVISPHPIIKIFKDMDDDGPITKLLPTLERFKNEDDDILIITIDDDTYYNKGIFEIHEYLHNMYDNKIITTFSDLFSFNGNHYIIKENLKINTNKFKINKESLIPHKQSYFIEGYSSVGYSTKLMNVSKIKELVVKSDKCSNSDDLIISKYLSKNNIPIIKVLDNIFSLITFLYFIRQKEWGYNKDALHKLQSHNEKYIECLYLLDK